MKRFIEMCTKYTGRIVIGIIAFIILSAFCLGLTLDIFFLHDILPWTEPPTDNKRLEKSQYYENLRFFVTTIGGAFIAFIGISLTVWGRILVQEQNEKIQEQIRENSKANSNQVKQAQEQIELSREASASERYEKASRMLGDDVLAVRIAGCQALRILGIGNKDMALQCVQLLLIFISNPYLDKKEKKKFESLTGKNKLEKIFPIGKKLKADIQAATESFSAICEHYYEKDDFLNLGPVDLPSYFWKNKEKGKISLPNAEIRGANLKRAYLAGANLCRAMLSYTNFEKADLHLANLQWANLTVSNLKDAMLLYCDLKHSSLWHTNLQGAMLHSADFSKSSIRGVNLSKANMKDVALDNANLSGTDMNTAENLTTWQILSAKWTPDNVNNKLELNPPKLPKKLLKDKDIQEWLENPSDN